MTKETEKTDTYTKQFVIDTISRQTFVDLEFATKEQVMALSDEDMGRLADAIGDATQDGNDAYWETFQECVKDFVKGGRA